MGNTLEFKKKPLILIVDDIEANIQLLATMLSESGFDIGVAYSGSEALDSVSAYKPDLILLDIMMPEMDGFEVAKILKNNDLTKDIPIIYLTAKADISDITKGFELGANDYVTKPFQSQELLARVNTHLKLKFLMEELVQINNIRNKFFSIISHDLKNPFSGILGLAEMLSVDADKLSLEEVKNTGQVMYKSAKVLYELLENLLEWSRSQLGTIEFIQYPLDLNDYIDKAISIYQLKADQKQISLRSFISTEAKVFADNYMLNTILRNLIGNAIKFTPNGGIILIGATACEDSSLIKLFVRDSGIGIPKENHDKIFRIDTKYVRTGTNNEVGTGLGLILTKELVERHGGQIWFESEEGQGTTFYFTLPKFEARFESN